MTSWLGTGIPLTLFYNVKPIKSVNYKSINTLLSLSRIVYENIWDEELADMRWVKIANLGTISRDFTFFTNAISKRIAAFIILNHR
jgi:hypothetical protein